MPEMFINKPVVKLPKKRQSFLTERPGEQPVFHHPAAELTAATPNEASSSPPPLPAVNGTRHIQPQEGNNSNDYLTSDYLYFDGLFGTQSDSDVMDLIKSCDPVEIRCQRDGSGYIRFPSRVKADRAYTLFNAAYLKNNVRLQLRIHPPDGPPEPEATSGILQITNLPLHATNAFLYDHFRKFGPMNLCKIIMEQGTHFRGTALVQYFRTQDADVAATTMNGKMIHGCVISVFPFVSKKTRPQSVEMEKRASAPVGGGQQQSRQQQTGSAITVTSASPNAVDYTNLYIKNLDLNVKSSDLFSAFRRFGRIISARVMKNTQTRQSKGFGFVSFGKADEAARALQEMNNTYILSKPIIVAFHEPKKPRDGTGNQQQQETARPMVKQQSLPTQPQSLPLIPSSLPLSFPSYHAAQPDYYRHNLPPPPPTRLGRRMTALSMASYDKQRNTSSPGTFSAPLAALGTNGCTPMTTTVPTTAELQPSVTQPQHTSPPAGVLQRVHTYKLTSTGRPTMRRRTSAESMSSVMTETSSGVQKQRMVEAIIACCGTNDMADELADMLLTLKRKERSLCLFNQDFLRAKLQQARTALAICDDDELDVHSREARLSPQNHPAQPAYHHTSPPTPPPSRPKPPVVSEASKVLRSMEGKTVLEKKQALGDKLFPLVKATGVKHANKVTIRLLDTVPLSDLARVMFDDKSALQPKILTAVKELQRISSNSA
ncbi:hypothetical protein BCR43DRAFT_490369 [Syncephalastrum racemosum]|uniref:Uncharacterized protein n=1 Tax=Syncephalastrum racemosum TaxID=13706 RepID=A0A1X2HFQ2_SYNRA|nr:hypothetical protein BCR43DRAFT_490369 [Syncephalastrum racemosum]